CPRARCLDRVWWSLALSVAGLVGDEFEQRAVGVTEIDAGASPLGAETPDRPGMDRNPAALEMADRVGNRTGPFETEIAVAGLHGQPRHLGGMKAGAVQIELRRTEAVGPALRAANELGAEHVVIERVRALPIGDVHDAVIEGDG